jgi:hypothetical protein
MNTQKPKQPVVTTLERVLATLAASACLFITIAVWRSVSATQSMWPLPGFYFIEIPLVSVLAALAFLFALPSAPRIAWVTAGICGAFAFLAMFTVGLLYVPIALMYLLLAVLATSRRELPFLPGLGSFLAAAVAQAAFIIFAVRVVFP